MKKYKPRKYISDEQILKEIDDHEGVHEEMDEPFYDDEEESMEDITVELHEEDFTQFKKSPPSDWDS